MVEVLRRHSRHPYVLARLERTIKVAEEQGSRRPVGSPPKPVYALARRMSSAAQAELVAAYQSGATARELGSHYGMGHTAILGLLKKHGVSRRPRGSKPGTTRRDRCGRFDVH